jgi:hypothetical protein
MYQLKQYTNDLDDNVKRKNRIFVAALAFHFILDGYLTCWSTRLVGWLIGRLVGLLPRTFGLLVNQSFSLPGGFLFGWLAGYWPVNYWLTGWLAGWLFIWLVGFLTGSLAG